ncbi:hypothetical protein H072_4799 [Dactylellina haptotyla CBS 200.50]|uniref:Uncharacterized protein n=1 Tax=Dactylellina haptotyla (strain CBS 200.50) TaxID=1284197 RepID=S8C0S5_DACHA|nr:hypothetical protein H072_4799 [Dactylellina haptotyla CBS 200.50]
MSLQSKVDDLKRALSTATARLQNLDAESKEAIEKEIGVLHNALSQAAGNTVKLIAESKKGRNLLLFRTDKSVTKRVSNQLNVVIQCLDVSISSSDRLLGLSMYHIKEVEEFKNEYIHPTKQQIQITVRQVEQKKATVNRELSQKRTEASKAANELSKAASELQQKQNELSSNKSKLWDKEREVRNAEEQTRDYERQARDLRDQARAASERAESLRTRAVWTTVLTLGLGVGFAIADLCSASDLESNASDYSSRASNSSSRASSLKSTCYSIERQIASLELESRSLESQKSSLEWKKDSHQREVKNLESRMSTLNWEVSSANSLSSDLRSVDAGTEQLAETTRLLQQSLTQLKADISGCLDTLTEQRDFGVLTARKASKTYISEEKRLQILGSAGDVLPQIKKSQKLLPDPRYTFSH